MGTTIRLAEPADAQAMLAIYEPFVRNTPVSFETEVPGEQEFRTRIEQTLAFAPWLVCDVEGSVAGYAYATRYRAREAYQWSVESTVYVAEPFRRRGIAGSLYRNLLRCLEAQGFINVYAAIALPNPASISLHAALGFRPIGVFRAVGHKLNAWHDVGWWALALQAAPEQPAPPRPPAEVARELRWEPPVGGKD
jgi:phosphinothricin acetyltransferase